FLRRMASSNHPAPHLLDETIAELTHRDWPGNIRELRNAIEHGALMARAGAIAPEHLPPPTFLNVVRGGGERAEHARIQRSATFPAEPAAVATLSAAARAWADAQLGSSETRADLYQQFLAAAEPALFESVLAATSGNRAQAAALLGIHRATLRKKLSGDPSAD